MFLYLMIFGLWGGSFSRNLNWFPRAVSLSGAASVISFGGWVFWALSMSVGFVRRSVSGSTIVLGG